MNPPELQTAPLKSAASNLATSSLSDLACYRNLTAVTSNGLTQKKRSNRFIDRTGQTYGRLTARAEVGRDKGGNVFWFCDCLCGGETVVRGCSLASGDTTSCGCYQREVAAENGQKNGQKLIDRTGQTFGLLIARALAWMKPRKGGRFISYWRCECLGCGGNTVVETSSLVTGATKSCGCLNRKIAAKRMSSLNAGRVGESHPGWKGDGIGYDAAHREAHQRTSNEYRIAAEKLTEARTKFGVTLADEEFFAREHGQKHVGTPWFPPQAQRVRDDVFISAVSLHRAFIDAAAKPLRNNLGVFINAMAAAPFSKASKEELLPDLWASLFLMVPLISTTFASVNRMLGRLPVDSLGWLLVDEAGQASPQSVVGALMRARRVVIVGDPAQVEPVVMLPDALSTAICLRFGVEPEQFGAPAASVQSLADAASSYRSEFTTRIGYRTVGAPLLVHRRCAEPMFSISNAIAYSGLMVLATPQRSSRIAETLGPSRWFNIAGTGEDKWCPQEGEEVLKLLRQLADADVKPDLYIVTPFVIVADRLRQMIRTSGILEACRIEDTWSWTAERVGTIHTVQGREAEAVLFVLGAPLPQQTGARTWAGARPNLLNVAVTRAQEAIYVIGNRDLWQSVGVFTQLANRLPID